jgi:hypothetical protein
MLALLLSGSRIQAQVVPARARALRDAQAVLRAPEISVTTAPAYPPTPSASHLASDSAVTPFAIKAHPVGVSAAAVDTAADDTTDTTAARPTHHHHILLGMAIGTVAGAGIGYVWAKAPCLGGGHHSENDLVGCDWGSGLGLVYGALAGWLVGGIIGAYTERRVPGYPDRHVSLEMIPQRGHGMAVTVRVH